MNKETIIRPAKLSDCAACQRLGRVPEIAIAPKWYLPLAYYQRIVRGKSIFLVAEVNKKIVGFVIAEKIEAGYLAQYIVVNKKYRQEGIGLGLARAMETEAKKRSAYFLLGYAVVKSLPMQKMLKKLGWHRGQATIEWSKGLS